MGGNLRAKLLAIQQGGNVVSLDTSPALERSATLPHAEADMMSAALDKLAADNLARLGAASSSSSGAPEAVATVPRYSPALTVQEGVERINRSCFFAPHAGQMTAWRESTDPETGARNAVPVPFNSVRLEFANVMVKVPTSGSGERNAPVADQWLQSKSRREYPGGVVLWPEGEPPAGTYNRWQGFGVAPKAGDASPMLDHVQMVCGGDDVLAGYVLNWLSRAVQHPGLRAETAIVLRGGQGTGKGTLVRPMLQIFGHHALQLTQHRHLVGNFNGHLHGA